MEQLKPKALRSYAEAVIMGTVSTACERFDQEPAAVELFEILRHSKSVIQTKERERQGSGCDFEIWLPSLDTSRTLVTSPRPAVRAVVQRVRQVGSFWRLDAASRRAANGVQ